MEIGYIFEHQLNATYILPNDLDKFYCVKNLLDISLETTDFSLVCSLVRWSHLRVVPKIVVATRNRIILYLFNF